MKGRIIWWKTTLTGIMFFAIGLVASIISLYGSSEIFVGLQTLGDRLLAFGFACFGIGFGAFLIVISIDRFEIKC